MDVPAIVFQRITTRPVWIHAFRWGNVDSAIQLTKLHPGQPEQQSNRPGTGLRAGPE
jgi:hypothetical protein